MTEVTFFPLGNADSTLILTKSGKLILVDYGNMATGEEDDLRVDLKTRLTSILAELKRTEIDVVVFTHLDKDHYKGFSDFFYLQHADKYQTDGRFKIKELWAPAAMILEEGGQVDGEADILRAEARYRFLNGEGIRVFSKPEILSKWLEDRNLSLKDRGHLVADAGELVDIFTLEDDGVEIFPHAPFAADLDGVPGDELRNDSSIVLQMTCLVAEGRDIKVMFGADIASSVWDNIVRVTEFKGNENRLEWDIFKLSHHCSYRSLNEANWEENYEPTEPVKRLFEKYSREGAILVSTSGPIDENEDTNQPPHKEAAEYYESIAKTKNGQFIVTMEYPSKDRPDLLKLKIDDQGLKIYKGFKIPITFIKSNSQAHTKPGGLWAWY